MLSAEIREDGVRAGEAAPALCCVLSFKGDPGKLRHSLIKMQIEQNQQCYILNSLVFINN